MHVIIRPYCRAHHGARRAPGDRWTAIRPVAPHGAPFSMFRGWRSNYVGGCLAGLCGAEVRGDDLGLRLGRKASDRVELRLPSDVTLECFGDPQQSLLRAVGDPPGHPEVSGRLRRRAEPPARAEYW